MATEIYQPPQELGPITKIYALQDEGGSSVYEDPTDELFTGGIQVVGQTVTIAVA